MYPAVTARLREEILDKVGPTRRPTYDDIRDLKYLRAVINGRADDTRKLSPSDISLLDRNLETVSYCVRLNVLFPCRPADVLSCSKGRSILGIGDKTTFNVLIFLT